MMVMRKKVHEGKAARREAKEALEELNAIDGKVHEAFEKYLKGATELCEVLEAGIEDGEDEFLKELKKKWDAVQAERDRKSTRLNSSHVVISYAVFCLKKKNN